jgi:uncharacterized membrane protein
MGGAVVGVLPRARVTGWAPHAVARWHRLAEGGRRRRAVKSFGDAFSRYGIQLLLLAAVAAMSCANQLFLKAGVSQGGPIAISLEGLVTLLRRIFTTPLILVGYALGGLTNLVWLTALSRFEISFAAPVVSSLSFIFLLAASALVLGEAVGSNRWVGTALIVAGMLLVGRK